MRRVLAAKCTAARMYSSTHRAMLKPPNPQYRHGISPPFTHRHPHPAQLVNDFRTSATQRLISQYPQEGEVELPVSEMTRLVRESVKAGDFESAEQLYLLSEEQEGFDPDGALATFLLVQLADRKDGKAMLRFIEEHPHIQNPFTMELLVGVILQTFDHEALDRWYELNNVNNYLVPYTAELLEEMLVQVYLPHLRWDAVARLLLSHPALISADSWMSLLEFGLTPRPVDDASWTQLRTVLCDLKKAKVHLSASFGEALEAFLSKHYPPTSFLNFVENEL